MIRELQTETVALMEETMATASSHDQLIEDGSMLDNEENMVGKEEETSSENSTGDQFDVRVKAPRDEDERMSSFEEFKGSDGPNDQAGAGGEEDTEMLEFPN
jgi:hypothetical protein